MYQNYHKHTSYSNIWGYKDSHLTPKNYFDVLKDRYGDKPCVYSSVEHGFQSPFHKIVNQINDYNKKNGTNIKPVFGTEAYWVKDRFEKDNSNCHIILLARNNNGRIAINRILSEANLTGYYYRPRIDLDLLLTLPKEDVFVTTACAKFHEYEDTDEIIKKLNEHFTYFYLEIQCHNTEKNIKLNEHLLELHIESGIPFIAGIDSHYIDESQSVEREYLLKSDNGKSYNEDEDGWYMDYPTKDALINRFKELHIFTESQIVEAVENTNLILDFEDIELDRSIKVPVVNFLKDKTQDERNEFFKNILRKEWKKQKHDINRNKYDEYVTEIKDDINQIISCNMADYFILSYYIMKNGQEQYGGRLTRTGRGSAPSMFVNKLLNLTNIDAINADVKMYPSRFLTAERVLNSHTPPDIDNNITDREPFIQAQKDLIGEDGTCDLIAFGTLKRLAAWKMYARANNIEPEIANEISKQITKFENALKHSEEELDLKDYVEIKYLDLIKNSESYMGIVETAKGHPCGCICTDIDIKSEIGLLRCKSESTNKETMTVLIESDTIDSYGYLKQDYLIVKSISLTYETYDELGIKPLTINQLLDKIKDDKSTWDIYAKGLTVGINQVEQPASREKVMRFKPQNISELCQFVAGIRPSFQTMYKKFENREHFEYGIKALDSTLQDEYMTSSFILYQESLMKVLEFSGFPIGKTYEIIKAISKKKKYVIDEAKPKFIEGFTNRILESKETDDKTKAEEMAYEVWKIIENSASYGFNASHSYSMAIDSVEAAYLKAHYPMQFYKSALNIYEREKDKDKMLGFMTEMLKQGITILPIKFRDDNRKFEIKNDNCITTALSSIKGMPSNTSEILYELGHKTFNTKEELFLELKSCGVNKKGLEILFALDYFEEFGNPKELKRDYEIFKEWYGKKVISKEKISPQIFEAIKNIEHEETEKQFRKFDSVRLIEELTKNNLKLNYNKTDKIKAELKYLGYTHETDSNANPEDYIVSALESDKYNRNFITLYQPLTGYSVRYKVDNKWWNCHKCEIGDVLHIVLQNKTKWKKVNDNFIKTKEIEKIIKMFSIIE